jgi:hypothetical protein
MNIVQARDWFSQGVFRVLSLFRLVGRRFNIGIALIRLLFLVDEKKKERDRIYKKIGKRLSELAESPQHDILSDSEMKEYMEKLREVEAEISSLKEKAEALNTLDEEADE